MLNDPYVHLECSEAVRAYILLPGSSQSFVCCCIERVDTHSAFRIPHSALVPPLFAALPATFTESSAAGSGGGRIVDLW
jgi:hypothetical protein